MPDDLTIGELGRRLADVHQDLKDDLREVGHRLDKKVSLERYQLEQQALLDTVRALVERVGAIETAREEERQQRELQRRAAEDRRRADRRWILSALIAPTLLVLLQAYLTARGAGS